MGRIADDWSLSFGVGLRLAMGGGRVRASSAFWVPDVVPL